MTAPDGGSPLAPGDAARMLDEVLFGKVAALFSLAELYDLEATLAQQMEHLGIGRAAAREHARSLVDRALLRIARTPRNWKTFDEAACGETCELCGERLAVPTPPAG